VRRGFLLVRPQGEEPGLAAIPQDQWTRIETVPRVARGSYYAYLAGMALVLAAGSALLVAGYLFLARRVRNRWLGPPLPEVARRAPRAARGRAARRLLRSHAGGGPPPL